MFGGDPSRFTGGTATGSGLGRRRDS